MKKEGIIGRQCRKTNSHGPCRLHHYKKVKSTSDGEVYGCCCVVSLQVETLLQLDCEGGWELGAIRDGYRYKYGTSASTIRCQDVFRYFR